MTFEAILKDLEQKQYKPIYFLQGDEPYYIDVLSDYLEANVLDEADKSFNQTIVYGKDIDIPTLVSYAKRYPMMAPYQVLIVKEAQDLKKIDELLHYFENPLPSTILVFCHKYKELDKRTKLAKLIDKKAVLFTSDKLYDNKIPTWVEQYLSKKGKTITGPAAQMIADYLGNDLSKVVNELDKLLLNMTGKQQITPKEVEENIGISKDFNVFELQTAFAKKDVLKANQIANYFAANPKNSPLVLTLGTLYSYFSKLLLYHSLPDKSKPVVASALRVNPYFVGDYETAARSYPVAKLVDIISYLREYDMKSKGWDNASANEGALLKELVYKILH